MVSRNAFQWVWPCRFMKLVGPADDFCMNLAQHLGSEFVEMERRRFPDGEINPRIQKAPAEVLLVNTLSSQNFDPNRYLLEYIFSIKNLREQGTERIVLVLPYLPYSRQDVVFKKGESFTSKYVLEIFRDLAITDVFAVSFHLHRQRAVQLVEGITLHDISGFDALGDYLNQYQLKDPLCVAPDEEAGKWAQKMAEKVKGGVAVLKKRRDLTTGAVKTSGEIPEGRTVIIVDDMISTGGTIRNALDICRKFKSKTVLAAAVHGIFSVPITLNIEIITTNTIENPYAKVDVTPYVARAIAQEL